MKWWFYNNTCHSFEDSAKQNDSEDYIYSALIFKYKIVRWLNNEYIYSRIISLRNKTEKCACSAEMFLVRYSITIGKHIKPLGKLNKVYMYMI